MILVENFTLIRPMAGSYSGADGVQKTQNQQDLSELRARLPERQHFLRRSEHCLEARI